MTPNDLFVSMAIGFIVMLITSLYFARRPLASVHGGGYSSSDIRKGRLTIILGLAAIMGASGYGSSLSTYVSLAEDTTSIPGIVRFFLTFTLCWYTFNGRRWAYLLMASLIGLGFLVTLVTTFALETEGIMIFPMLFLLTHWCVGLFAILSSGGRQFLRYQRDEYLQSKSPSGLLGSLLGAYGERPIPASEVIREMAGSKAARLLFILPVALMVGYVLRG